MKRVYFIKPIGMDGPIKIGCSASPGVRRDALATWSPFPLEVVATIEGGFDLETRFHKHFAELHERREWFTAGPELVSVIEQVQAGTFDPATLVDRTTGNAWRARRPLPEWNGKQAALARQCWRTQYETGFKCPVDYNLVYRHGRAELLPAVQSFLADPAKFGVHCTYPDAEAKRSALTHRPVGAA